MNAPGIIAAAAFLRAHTSVAAWPADLFLAWFRWHWANGGVGVVRLRGRIVGVGVARCVHSDAEAAHTYAHDENAAILWVDQLASIHPLGLPILLAQARGRFGPRKAVRGHVLKRPGELRMLPWKRVERLLSHHGLN